MKNIKNIFISIFMVMMMIFTFTACGGKNLKGSYSFTDETNGKVSFSFEDEDKCTCNLGGADYPGSYTKNDDGTYLVIVTVGGFVGTQKYTMTLDGDQLKAVNQDTQDEFTFTKD